MTSNVEMFTEKKVAQEHSLEVDGTQLCEKKVVTTFCAEGSDTTIRTETVHTRWIGGRSYTAIDVEDSQNSEATNRSVQTSMDDDEVQAFLEEWTLKWNPTVDEAVVARAQEVPVHGGAYYAQGQVIQGEQPNGEGQEEDNRTDEQKAEDEQKTEDNQ